MVIPFGYDEVDGCMRGRTVIHNPQILIRDFIPKGKVEIPDSTISQWMGIDRERYRYVSLLSDDEHDSIRGYYGFYALLSDIREYP